MVTSVSVKRVYDPPAPSDDHRLLVDGLWPRGIKRELIPEGTWVRDIAPSSELRSWYGHESDKFDEFVARYRQELDANPSVDQILCLGGHLTLLTAVRNVEISHAAVLRDYLIERVDDTR